MEARIECSTCHRVERWRPHADGFQKVVVTEGGGRRPAVHPQWARGLTALACADDPRQHVAAVCPACGQLMITEAGDVPSVPVEIGTPEGSLAIAESDVTGPEGEPMSPDEARAFLEAQYRHAGEPDLTDQLLKTPLFIVVGAVASSLVLGVFFVVLFVAAVFAGGPGS